MHTERLELRALVESDRAFFVEQFADDVFMEFSGGVLGTADAGARFDTMLRNARELSFAKQPVIERATGVTVGYIGVGRFDFEGERRVEFGYRLVPEARGRGYATEAGLALLDLARESFVGTIYAMIDPRNEPSQRVAAKLGFSYWKQATVNGFLDNLYRLEI